MNRLTQLQRTLFFILLLAEGGVVLAHQVVAPKILEPVFGNSVVVWSAVLVCTLVGLSIGYVLGDRICGRSNALRLLGRNMLASAILLYAMPLLGAAPLLLSDGLPFKLALVLAASIIVIPLMSLLGTCCPLAIAILYRSGWSPAGATGAVFSISTLGGILTASVVAVWALPFIGIRLTCFGAASLLFLAALPFCLVSIDRESTIETTE